MPCRLLRGVPRRGSLEQVQVEVGERVRAARVAAGMTQEAAADAAGIDVKRWQRLEAGQVNATLRTLHRAAKATGSDYWAMILGK